MLQFVERVAAVLCSLSCIAKKGSVNARGHLVKRGDSLGVSEDSLAEAVKVVFLDLDREARGPSFECAVRLSQFDWDV